MQKDEHPAKNPALSYSYKDGLDFHDDKISLLLSSGHYYILYYGKENIPLDYDKGI